MNDLPSQVLLCSREAETLVQRVASDVANDGDDGGAVLLKKKHAFATAYGWFLVLFGLCREASTTMPMPVTTTMDCHHDGASSVSQGIAVTMESDGDKRLPLVDRWARQQSIMHSRELQDALVGAVRALHGSFKALGDSPEAAADVLLRWGWRKHAEGNALVELTTDVMEVSEVITMIILMMLCFLIGSIALHCHRHVYHLYVDHGHVYHSAASESYGRRLCEQHDRGVLVTDS